MRDTLSTRGESSGISFLHVKEKKGKREREKDERK